MKLMSIIKDIWETAKTVLPLAVMMVILQVIVLKKPIKDLKQFAFGILLSISGLYLFLKGVYMSILPLGDSVGNTIVILDNKWLIVGISFVIGYLGTLVEPALKTLALEVEEVSVGAIPNKVLIYAVAVGFGFGMGLGIWKILNNIAYAKILVPLLLIIIALVPFVPKEFVSIAMDSASATTGPVNIPLNMAIAVGLAKSLENVDPLTSGFGIVGLTSVGAIISVIVLGLLTRI